MRKAIIIRQSVFIYKPREIVWEFTQNYDNRIKWDSSVLETTVLQTLPNRIVKLKMKGNTSMTFVYKLDDQPRKTTLAIKEIESPIFETGGGSWIYEEQNNRTLWTQNNTIVFKNNLLWYFLSPVFKWILNKQTKQAMIKAKRMIERL